jgi:hypothetical protein
MDETLTDKCERLRATLRQVEVEARGIREHPALKEADAYLGQHGEMIAQSMLAVRHIEDARMRLGKVLQYAGDGVSIFDKA